MLWLFMASTLTLTGAPMATAIGSNLWMLTLLFVLIRSSRIRPSPLRDIKHPGLIGA